MYYKLHALKYSEIYFFMGYIVLIKLAILKVLDLQNCNFIKFA